MKHLATLSFTLAALAAAPAALAGSEILKCVDRAGNVTLTDQPCESGARATRMVSTAASAPAAAPGPAHDHRPDPGLDAGSAAAPPADGAATASTAPSART